MRLADARAVLVDQGLVAREGEVLLVGAGLRLGQGRLSRKEIRFELRRIDLVENGAFLDLAPFLEGPLQERALDARLDVHALGGPRLADERSLVADLFLRDHFRHDARKRFVRLSGLFAVGAGTQEKRQRK
ncbi:hypothetical protein AUC70_03435 [Methyloceanibacter stevinii]|uniref:Uncharacterized protein n=1 Tax=Methyloceanibacter stevinii TaxID=1774970 RepID=A0A1E3VQX8_9HYPH|nr:hypothetical protein AUC70_03435 [Methyloceanibacter stevinii]